MNLEPGRPIVMLDVDGVLNRYHWSGGMIRAENVAQLSRVLDETGAAIVLSSAWRYQVHNGDMTLLGFQYMMMTHGLTADFVGLTRLDAERGDEDADADRDKTERALQVLEWLACSSGHGPYVVIDDNDLGFSLLKMPLVHTDCRVGLTAADADKAIAILGGKVR